MPQSNADCQFAEAVIHNDDVSKSFEENIGTDQLHSELTIRDGTSSTATVNPRIHSSEIDNRKRSHAKQLIESYFYQLTIGCGNSHCRNENCASNIQVEALTPNQAAARAIKLFTEDAKFCNSISSKSTSSISKQKETNSKPSDVHNKLFLDDR